VKAELLPTARKRQESAAKFDCLYPGLYVLCFYEAEWHRALVTHINPVDQQHATVGNSVEQFSLMTDFFLTPVFCQVELIDYGTKVLTPLGTLRYMTPKMLEVFPAQAIKCRLYFEPPYDGYLAQAITPWTPQNSNHFFQLLKERFLGVTFRKREVEPMEQDPTVSIAVPFIPNFYKVT